jgi:hypothetical protein
MGRGRGEESRGEVSWMRRPVHRCWCSRLWAICTARLVKCCGCDDCEDEVVRRVWRAEGWGPSVLLASVVILSFVRCSCNPCVWTNKDDLRFLHAWKIVFSNCCRDNSGGQSFTWGLCDHDDGRDNGFYVHPLLTSCVNVE